MATWTSEQVTSLAPDASSVTAARGLAGPRAWTSTGHDDRAVWGRIRGYLAMVDLSGPAFACTCPSRKVPCKHALALLLLFAMSPEVVAARPAPAEVEDWLASRARRAARAARATESGEKKPVDAEARARRQADRAARIAAGLEELDLWLRDLVRQGLASAQTRPFRYWDDAAARMVDAQAPGVAGQIRRMAWIVRSGDGWPERLLVQAGRLHLVARAWARLDSLPADVQADLRTVVGWSWNSDEVLAGPAVRDHWDVVARAVAEEERFRISRTWLVGEATGRTALVLEFTPVSAPLPSDLLPGSVVDADLAFFPGSWPQRALVAQQYGEAAPMVRWTGAPTVAAALEEHARALGANPWLDRLPMVLADVVPVARDGRWCARDASGAAVPLLVDAPAWWTLAAVAGGHPVGLAGEWHDAGLRALAVWSGDRLVPLA